MCIHGIICVYKNVYVHMYTCQDECQSDKYACNNMCCFNGKCTHMYGDNHLGVDRIWVT